MDAFIRVGTHLSWARPSYTNNTNGTNTKIAVPKIGCRELLPPQNIPDSGCGGEVFMMVISMMVVGRYDEKSADLDQ